MHTATDAGSVDEAPQLAAKLHDLVDRVAGGAGELVDDDALLAGRLVQQRRLADVRAPEDRDPARAAELRLRDGGDVGQHLHDLVEEVGDAAPVDRRDGVGLTETEVPQGRGLRLLPSVVDLVRDEEDGLLRGAQQPHDGLVGRRRADHRVDDEQHHVGEVDRDLGLRGDGAVDALGIRLPPARVDEGEAAVHPLGLVRHAVTRDTRGVLDDGLAAAEDAVHERRLADVRPPDDRDHRQRRQQLDDLAAGGEPGEQVGVFVVEVVVGQRRAQRLGARFGELLVEVRHLLFEAVGAAFVLVVSGHRGSPGWVRHRPRRRPAGRPPRSVRNRGRSSRRRSRHRRR